MNDPLPWICLRSNREQERGRVVNEIQKARNVLAKHRESATPGNWRAWLRNDADTDLIMLTAGTYLAAAILSADERMSA